MSRSKYTTAADAFVTEETYLHRERVSHRFRRTSESPPNRNL